MFTGTAAAKIMPSQQNPRSLILWLVEDKTGVLPPIVEQAFTQTLFIGDFQVTGGDDLISINVFDGQGSQARVKGFEGFHSYFLLG
jgi:hypothetical protein